MQDSRSACRIQNGDTEVTNSCFISFFYVHSHHSLCYLLSLSVIFWLDMTLSSWRTCNMSSFLLLRLVSIILLNSGLIPSWSVHLVSLTPLDFADAEDGRIIIEPQEYIQSLILWVFLDSEDTWRQPNGRCCSTARQCCCCSSPPRSLCVTPTVESCCRPAAARGVRPAVMTISVRLRLQEIPGDLRPCTPTQPERKGRLLLISTLRNTPHTFTRGSPLHRHLSSRSGFDKTAVT